MSDRSAWLPAEPDLESVFATYPHPFEALAAGTTPAVILRRALDPEACRQIVARFYERQLIQETESPTTFDYVGTSLGMWGADPPRFFEHARGTHALYATVFSGLADPVRFVYETLGRLAPDRRVQVAREPDGRLYGPGIFRLYRPGAGHRPHFDSVRLREKRINYAVYRFEHQFAAILCLQGADPDPEAGECILHRVQWTPELQEVLQADAFHRYAAERGVPHVRIELAPGDFYVFNTRHIHEVPAIRGNTPRIVLAMFLGYSADDEEVFVWS
jgi:hypothetical protein